MEKSLKDTKRGNHELAIKIRDSNVKGIKTADVVIVIARNLGSDSSWESGFAARLGKLVILIRCPQDTIEEDYMLFNSVSQIVEIRYYKLGEIEQAINSLDFNSLDQRR